MRQDLTYMAAGGGGGGGGGGWYTEKNWIRLGDAKKPTIKAFWWFKGDLISQWIPKFYLCDESNPIHPQSGKISANFYISPPHPPHPQFYPQKWWKFRYTSWLTQKNCISIDLRCAQVNKAKNALQPIQAASQTVRLYVCLKSNALPWISMTAVSSALSVDSADGLLARHCWLWETGSITTTWKQHVVSAMNAFCAIILIYFFIHSCP